jgi:pimeloyl-ACP methyl ester carboxylesterase
VRLLKYFPWLLLSALAGCATIQDPIFNTAVAALRSSAALRTESIVIDGQEISYLEREGPGDTVILLHGFASEKDVWLRFVEYLPMGARILIPDLPGHGNSAPLDSMPYTPDVVIDLLSSLAKALDADRFHIVGNSVGGMYALVYAHTYPDQVLSLTLIDSGGIYPPNPSELQRSLASGANPLIVDEPQDFNKLMEFVFYRQPVMPWPAKPTLRRKYVGRSKLNHQIWGDIWASRRDQRDRLRDIPAPVLVIWGKNDRVLDVTTTDVIRHHKPDAIIEILPECGHSPMLEKPRRTASIFQSFIDRL